MQTQKRGRRGTGPVDGLDYVGGILVQLVSCVIEVFGGFFERAIVRVTRGHAAKYA